MRKESARHRVSLLVTDLDNTLWDWFHSWHTSFSAMLVTLSKSSGISIEQLEREMGAVHRKRGTTEYSNLLNELPSLCALHPDDHPIDIYDDAVYALNSGRLHATSLYPGVESTLRALHERRVPVVAFTESVAYWSEWRIKTTGLDGLITVLYSAPDHDLPAGVTVDDLRKRPPEEYGLKFTDHRHVPKGALKPNPKVLRAIISDFGLRPDQTVYVGDSEMKDVAMAQAVGAHDVHARYGVAHKRQEYELLRRVSHWTQEDIAREQVGAQLSTTPPAFTLDQDFSELMTHFEFVQA